SLTCNTITLRAYRTNTLFRRRAVFTATQRFVSGKTSCFVSIFRCMPEIIQFSNDLCYASSGTPLDPLGSYPPDRLTPLVVRHVKDGYRSGSAEHPINEPEAEAVVAQIIGCIDDPRYADRTMGVISLQNEAQAK